jgi:hypothetical protein
VTLALRAIVIWIGYIGVALTGPWLGVEAIEAPWWSQAGGPAERLARL